MGAWFGDTACVRSIYVVHHIRTSRCVPCAPSRPARTQSSWWYLWCVIIGQLVDDKIPSQRLWLCARERAPSVLLPLCHLPFIYANNSVFTFCRCSFARRRREKKKRTQQHRWSREKRHTEEIGWSRCHSKDWAFTLLIFDLSRMYNTNDTIHKTENNKHYEREKPLHRNGKQGKNTILFSTMWSTELLLRLYYILLNYWVCGTPKMIHSIKMVHVTNGIRWISMRQCIHLTTRPPVPAPLINICAALTRAIIQIFD